jgi:hypothetical protein
MVYNDRFELDGTKAATATLKPLASTPLTRSASSVSDKPVTLVVDSTRTLAEAEQWLDVIPPTAACYRLLQLGILRRDVALLEGLLSVLRNP